METSKPNLIDQDPKTITEVMTDDTLGVIVKQAQNIMAILPHLQALLPWELSGQYVVMNIRKDTLVVAVPNAAIATKIRYSEFELLAAMEGRPLLNQINKIIIKVKPDLFTYPKPQQKIKPQLSKPVRTLLNTTADSIEDKALQIALKKLANH